MPTLPELVILGLGAHRLWAIWLFLPWAARAKARYEASGRWWDKLASCEFCLSVWAGGVVTGIWLLPYGALVVTALAVGGLVFTWQEVQGALKAFILRQHGM